jgi:hypothetical protein
MESKHVVGVHQASDLRLHRESLTMNVKKFLLISALAAALLMGCTANGQEAAPDPADYDTDCRMREYGKPMTFNELDRYLDETSKRVLDEGKTWEEAADELGVPYYEKCKVTGGE